MWQEIFEGENFSRLPLIKTFCKLNFKDYCTLNKLLNYTLNFKELIFEGW